MAEEPTQAAVYADDSTPNKTLEDDSADVKEDIKDSYDDHDFDLDKFPVREFTFQPGFLSEPICFNPVVSAIGVSILWGLAIWCMSKLKRAGTCLI